VLTPFMVDTKFFTPVESPTTGRPTICSAGLERRDYPTLLRAVDGLDVDVVIAAASPWSRQRDSSEDVPLPTNVTIERLPLDQLRGLYGRSRLVVMPLLDVDFQAGITTILEAMAMGRAVVCTRTTGQTDTIIDDVTGRYVPPGDADALRAAIQRLLESPDTCRVLGAGARAWAVEHAELDRYVERLAAVVRTLATKTSGQ
jgi:glycosyltransferase involved in cell wall biosynthesis